MSQFASIAQTGLFGLVQRLEQLGMMVLFYRPAGCNEIVQERLMLSKFSRFLMGRTCSSS